MAKLTLDISSNAFQVFSEAEGKMDSLRDGVTSFSKSGSDAFKKVTDEAKGLGDEVKKGADDTKKFHEETTKLGKTANIYKQLKKEAKEYETQAFKAYEAGNKALGDELLAKAGKLLDTIGDMNAATKSLTGNIGENLARAAGNSIGLIATGMEGAASAQVLLGDKSKEFEETLLRLQALNGIANVAREFSGISDKLNEIKLGFSPVLDLYTSGNAKIKDFAKNADFSFKGLKNGIKDFASGAVSGFKSFASSGIAGIKAVGTAIAANPLGIILVVITAVIGAMVLLKDKVKPIADLFEFFGEVIDAVGDSLYALLETFGLVADASERAAQSMIDGQEDAIAAIEKRYDREIKLMQAAGKDTDRLEKEKLKAVQARVLQSIKALEYKRLREGELSDEETKKMRENMEKVKDLQVEFAAIDLAAAKAAADKKEEERKKELEKAKALAEKRKQLEKDLQAALLDLLKKSQAAELEGLFGKEKLDRQKQLAEAELSQLKATILEKARLLDANYKFTAAQEEQFGLLQLAINRKYADDLVKLEIEKANLIATQQKKAIDGEINRIDQQTKLRIAYVQALKAPKGQSEEEFELIKQRNILAIQKDAFIEQMQLKEDALKAQADLDILALENELKLLGDADPIKAAALKQNIQSIKDNVALETQVLQAETANQLDTFSQEIDKKTNEINSKGKLIDWQKLLGLNDEQMKLVQQGLGQIKNELQNFSNEIFSTLQQGIDQELHINEQKVSAREKEIDDLQAQLDKEEELRQQGLANNVDAIKQQIETEKAARDKELADRKKLQEEKKRLAKIQFAVDTAIQASNLITAVSEIFKTYAAVPYVAGALAALMLGSFTFAKIKAYQAIEESPEGFFKGGYTGDGDPHDEAGIVHKQEFVNTAEDTKKYRPLFEGIHKKDRKLIEIGVRDLLEGTGVILDGDIGQNLSNRKQEARVAEYHSAYFNDNSGVEKRIERVEGVLTDIYNQGSDMQYVLPNGNLVIQKGSHKRIIKK